MVSRLQQLGDSFGGSLEASLFERLLANLTRLLAAGATLTPDELNRLWEDLFGDFRNLAQNASDYLAHLKSDKVEEQMMTEAFIAYKNAFTQYLQNFILSMQRTAFKIEALLKKTVPAQIHQVAGRLADYQLSIPRLDAQPGREEWVEVYLDKYASLAEWFLGRPNHPSELLTLQNETTDTIRRIARFAQRIGERHQAFRSRRHDYLYLAGWFARLEDLDQAHRLSAMLFGVEHSRHLFAEQRLSDDFDRTVWEEAPTVLTLTPRVAGYREKTRPGAVIERSAEKRAALLEYIHTQREKEALIDRLITDHQIKLSELPEVDPYVRKTLLGWIARCMQREDRSIQTETGRRIRLTGSLSGRKVTLRSPDGVLELPDFTLVFDDSGGGERGAGRAGGSHG